MRRSSSSTPIITTEASTGEETLRSTPFRFVSRLPSMKKRPFGESSSPQNKTTLKQPTGPTSACGMSLCSLACLRLHEAASFRWLLFVLQQHGFVLRNTVGPKVEWGLSVCAVQPPVRGQVERKTTSGPLVHLFLFHILSIDIFFSSYW